MTGSQSTTFRRLSDDIVRTLKPPGAVYYCTLGVLLAVLAFGVSAVVGLFVDVVGCF